MMNQNRSGYSRQSPYNFTGPQKRPPARRRPRKKRSLAKYGFRIILFFVFFALVGSLSAGLFFLSLTGGRHPGDIVYEIKMTEIKNEKPTEVSSLVQLSRETGFFGGQYYFPINKIMENMGFVVVGDKSELSFFRKESDEYVKFITGSAAAYINGEKYRLPGPAFIDGDDNICVPLEFLENRFQNLRFAWDGGKNKITLDVGEVGEYCFEIHKAEALPPVEESPEFGSLPVEFKTDLSAYEKYFNPPANDKDRYLVLINASNPLENPDYVPPDLTNLADTRQDGRAVQQLGLYPAMALEAFLAEARANGFSGITVTSAYRSYDYQAQLFAEETARAGSEEAAAVSVARPGQSEHQSGLGVDMHNHSAANQDFGSTPDGIWLAENARHFGFILRYPKDKTEITGIKYEPWHFRYVGRRAASVMYEKNLCLEEYLG
ncbi:MAG: D-alanyl-D-alanine carboxypeptidase family protein [Oscillospiraceae bacterium]|nr:D-alanyl-D-alanine carboxypeptidase family protein [Oscillospiraceae bacterium]